MIITLVKADFSANNIGTLDSFAVLTNILNATYSGPTSVASGEAFTATITMHDGYSVPTDNMIISMGGIVLTDAYSVSGNVITISISVVTGNIVINMAGEIVEDTEYVDLTSEFAPWTAGTVTYKTGSTSTSDTNWVFSQMVDVSAYSQLKFSHIQTPNQETSLGYAFYSNTSVSSGIAGNSNGGASYSPVEKIIDIPEGAKYFRCMWINTTSANYNAEEHNIDNNFYCYGIA